MKNYDTITSEKLKERLDEGDDFLLVDTLGDTSYQRAHLPTAISISAKQDGFADRVAEQAKDSDQEVIVYCASFSCGLSSQAAQELVDAGFTNVVDYEGGLKDWVESGYSLEGEDAETMEEELVE